MHGFRPLKEYVASFVGLQLEMILDLLTWDADQENGIDVLLCTSSRRKTFDRFEV